MQSCCRGGAAQESSELPFKPRKQVEKANGASAWAAARGLRFCVAAYASCQRRPRCAAHGPSWRGTRSLA